MTNKKRAILACVISIVSLTKTYATNTENNFFIIPQAASGGKVASDVEEVGKTAGNVTNKYREISEQTGRSLGEQIASGIMSRNTLLDYVTYLIRFVSQVGILIGAIWIIIAGYKYAIAVFN